jgi:hypothetical protein
MLIQVCSEICIKDPCVWLHHCTLDLSCEYRAPPANWLWIFPGTLSADIFLLMKVIRPTSLKWHFYVILGYGLLWFTYGFPRPLR